MHPPLGEPRRSNARLARPGNTEVTTDIVVLRKRLPGELPSGPAWKTLGEITNSLGETIPLNEYFGAHPEMMLGEMRLEGRMYARSEPTLVGNCVPLVERLAEAIALLPRDVFRPQHTAVQRPTLEQTFPAPDHIKPNAYTLVNDQIGIREDDHIRVLDDLPLHRVQRTLPGASPATVRLRMTSDGSVNNWGFAVTQIRGGRIAGGPATVAAPWPNPEVAVFWTVSNAGGGAAQGSWVDSVYFSTNATWEAQDTRLLDNPENQVTVTAGAGYSRSGPVTLPVSRSGTYYLIFRTDRDNALYEGNDNNNTAAVAVTFNLTAPDLVPARLAVVGLDGGGLSNVVVAPGPLRCWKTVCLTLSSVCST